MVLEILSNEAVEEIHATSMRVLKDVGVEFPSKQSLDIFKQHGVTIDGARVFLDEDQVLKALEQIPKQFIIYGRNHERSIVVGGGEPVFAPGYGAPFLVDSLEGKRSATIEDYHKLAMLAHALPNQDLSNRVDLDNWMQAGRPDVMVRARLRCQELLAAHEDPPLDAIVMRQLKTFMESQV